MPYRYSVTVEHVLDPHGPSETERSIRFETVNHDDLLKIIERVKRRQILPEDEVAEFTIGLKLFSEVMLRHRQDPLFADLWPHLGSFMKRLKGGG